MFIDSLQAGLVPVIRAAPVHGSPAPSGAERKLPLPASSLATPVLIVEDEVMIAWQLQDLLEEMGFTDVRTAGSHSEALAEAESALPGLLVCDVNLGSGPDGIAAAAAIRAAGLIAVVFVTGYASDELRARIAEASPGAHLLRKPVEPRLLGASLQQLLGSTAH